MSPCQLGVGPKRTLNTPWLVSFERSFAPDQSAGSRGERAHLRPTLLLSLYDRWLAPSWMPTRWHDDHAGWAQTNVGVGWTDEWIDKASTVLRRGFRKGFVRTLLIVEWGSVHDGSMIINLVEGQRNNPIDICTLKSQSCLESPKVGMARWPKTPVVRKKFMWTEACAQ